jgi:hypothetical protein
MDAIFRASGGGCWVAPAQFPGSEVADCQSLICRRRTPCAAQELVAAQKGKFFLSADASFTPTRQQQSTSLGAVID